MSANGVTRPVREGLFTGTAGTAGTAGAKEAVLRQENPGASCSADERARFGKPTLTRRDRGA